MNIIVVGCGKIGIAIISRLLSEGHSVTAIDNDDRVVSEISNIYDVMSAYGNGADCDTLNEVGVQNSDVFVAVTGSDELNMLSCYIAKKMGAKHTVARIRNPEYNDQSLGFLRQQLDLSLVTNPERLAAMELFNILSLPSAVNIETFSGRSFEMVELILRDNSPFAGVKLSELRKKYDAKFLICVVKRGEEIYIPDGNFELQSGDKIGLTASQNEIQKLLKMVGILQKSARSVMILGGSKTAFYLSKMLLASGTSVKLIEQDEKRCYELGNELPGAVILKGDGASQEVLLEEGVRSMDAFVALTGMDEENILISIFAAAQNVPKVITKVNRHELSVMASKLGLDSIVSPQRIISDQISSYVRALQNTVGSNVVTLYKLMDTKAEALQFDVKSDFQYLQIPLKDMKLKQNTLIGGIIRGRKPFIPTGEDCILPGDKVIVITTGQQYDDLSDIMK